MKYTYSIQQVKRLKMDFDEHGTKFLSYFSKLKIIK